MPPPISTKASEKEHYVSNREFSDALVAHAILVNKARDEKSTEPAITEYIGTCILRIAEGLSRKPNFINYSFREEMVMDGVENCLKAVMNYDIKAATRTGKPNAFGYFTQICFFAFLRRIARENRYYELKLLYMESACIDAFANFAEEDSCQHTSGDSIVGKIRSRLDHLHGRDAKVNKLAEHLKKIEKNKKLSAAKRARARTSKSLEEFIDK